MAIYPNGGYNSNTKAQGRSQKRGEKGIKNQRNRMNVYVCACVHACVCVSVITCTRNVREASLCLSTICLTYPTGKQQSG